MFPHGCVCAHVCESKYYPQMGVPHLTSTATTLPLLIHILDDVACIIILEPLRHSGPLLQQKELRPSWSPQSLGVWLRQWEPGPGQLPRVCPRMAD